MGAKGNSGVAGLIQNREGAIGYVNQSYIRGKAVAAALQNKSGEFLKPSVAAGTKALNGISLDKDLAGKNPNPLPRVPTPSPPSPGCWPMRRAMGKTLQVVQEALNYMLSDAAQDKAPSWASCL